MTFQNGKSIPNVLIETSVMLKIRALLLVVFVYSNTQKKKQIIVKPIHSRSVQNLIVI